MNEHHRRAPRWRRLDDLPIRGKLAVLVSLSSALGLVVAGGIVLAYLFSMMRTNTVRDLQTLTNIMADSTSAALAFGDAHAAGDTLDSLKAHTDIARACLYGAGPTLKLPGARELFAQYVRPAAACPESLAAATAAQYTDTLTVTSPVGLAGEQLGTLVLTQDLQRQHRALWLLAALVLGSSALSFAASGAVAWLMQRAITGPLLRLAQTARRVSETRDFSARVDPAGRDEVGRLIEDFNEMLEQIARGEARLRETQAQLLQSEKLASLGAMVAGMAHEINTPLGVGVSAASTLQALAEQIRSKHDGGQMTRTDLQRFVQLAIESADMVLRNLQRAADLIQSFKQVAVDQASGERRSFGLKKYLDEVVVSLSPKLRNTRHKIVVQCPASLLLDSYPGAIAQIVTNFITNSLLHGFSDGRDGVMTIDAALEGESVVLRYRDNGVGIDAANVPRVFEPFFTTRRGTGGSGLGLNVVYNLVTQRLGGTVKVESATGRGCEFTVQFPLQRTLQEAAA